MFDQLRFLLLIFLFFTWSAYAQDVKVQGQFQTDSIKIGLAFPYSLSASYPKEQNILFPDSTYSFEPFEIDHKVFFPTITNLGQSHDSVVYYLTSFEIDSVQKFRLPVFIVHPNDCTAVFSNLDSVYLQQLVSQMPDSLAAKDLPLKTNTAYQKVIWLLNYPLALIIGGVIIIIGIVSWIVFGKRIKQYFVLRRLNKYHHQFIKEFESAVEKLQSSYSIAEAEATLGLWKKYMEGLLAIPYTKYTTKEIFQRVKDEHLAKALRKIDWNIYGEGAGLDRDPLMELKQFTDRKFIEKVQEVKNG